MGKQLNFKTVNGVQYRVVTDREAQVGDYVLYDVSLRSYIEEGKPYEVVRVDSCDDPQIIDEDGDEFDTAYSGAYELLEKIGSVLNDLVTHEGVTYRKVVRDAKPGDKFVVPNESAMDYTAGKIYEIIRLDRDGDPRFIDDIDDEYHVVSGSYTVLEPVTIDEELSVAQARVAELEAKKKELVEANRLKVGDYAKVVVPGEWCVPVGRIVEVIEDDETYMPFRTKKLNGDFTGWFRVHELVRATDEEVAEARCQLDRNKIKPGVTVRLVIEVGKYPKHGWGDASNGDIGKVRTVDGSSVRVDFPNQSDWKAHIDELTIATEEETRLLVGEYAKVVANGSDHSANNGDFVKIVRDDRSKLPFRCETVDGKVLRRPWFQASDLTRVSDEEVKWAGIGRKVGEFKAGDIVRLNRNTGGHLRQGDITVLDYVRGTSIGFGEGYVGETDWIEMVAPVESTVKLKAS
ncbi:hypothetical protein EEL30_15625 [Brevibacillus laterosporus]|uniref:Uncharacterized protein n=1 Tax=Brevibacillus laterosporus TaxID=1465 RepID=A0A518V9C0_BRELA|nr:hypothetical protein EEL30_15625 [Brevibacillus laterosporus]